MNPTHWLRDAGRWWSVGPVDTPSGLPRHRLALGTLLPVLTLIAYTNALPNKFVWDDDV